MFLIAASTNQKAINRSSSASSIKQSKHHHCYHISLPSKTQRSQNSSDHFICRRTSSSPPDTTIHISTRQRQSQPATMCCNRNRNRNYVSGRANTCGSRNPGPLRLALLELVAHVQAKRAAKQQLRLQSEQDYACLLYTSPSPRDGLLSRMPSSA